MHMKKTTLRTKHTLSCIRKQNTHLTTEQKKCPYIRKKRITHTKNKIQLYMKTYALIHTKKKTNMHTKKTHMHSKHNNKNVHEDKKKHDHAYEKNTSLPRKKSTCNRKKRTCIRTHYAHGYETKTHMSMKRTSTCI